MQVLIKLYALAIFDLNLYESQQEKITLITYADKQGPDLAGQKLTHLCLVDSSTITLWTCPFPI